MEENFDEVKEDLVKSIIYFIMAIRPEEERNLDAIIRYLSMDRELMRNFEELFSKDHLSYKYFIKVESLNDDEYNKVAKSIILMLGMGIIEEKYEYSFPAFENENDVDNYVKDLFQK